MVFFYKIINRNIFLKFSKYYLFSLMLTAVFSVVMVDDIYAGEKREGLLISVGGGAGKTEITFESDDRTKERYTSNGFAFSARMGWCFNEYVFLYWDMRESVYFAYKPANNNTYHAGLWSALGLSLFQNDSPNSFYVTGAYGLGDLETGKFNSDAIVGTGISYLLGLGYTVKNMVGIEISTMTTNIK
jgi:hypothetical protein